MLWQSRRAFLRGLSSWALGGVASAAMSQPSFAMPRGLAQPASGEEPLIAPAAIMDIAQHYGPVSGEPFPVPGINLRQIDPNFLIKTVNYEGAEEPGTIVIDPAARFLYLVQDGGKAIRYGVGVGRQGFGWSGTATIKSKQEWPDWYPPAEMIERQPELREKMAALQSGIGMHGGPGNPLGARAMYLWQGNKDTLYRIHGTVEPWTIGKRVSSGCIRMINQDAIDLYERVALDTQVVVLGSGAGGEVASRRRRSAPQDPLDDPSWQYGDGGAYDPYQRQPPYRGPQRSAPYRPQWADPYDPYGRVRPTDPYPLQGDLYQRPYYAPGRRYDPYYRGYPAYPGN
jgi:lipoprotein-anchoring transpeptidase ErfK/SrfK